MTDDWLNRMIRKHPLGVVHVTTGVMLGLGVINAYLIGHSHMQMWIRPWWQTNLSFGIDLALQVLHLLTMQWIIGQIGQCLKLGREMRDLGLGDE